MSKRLGRLDSEQDKKIDVYAFAITMFEIATKESNAWKGLSNEEIESLVMNGERPQFPPLYLDKFKNCDGFTQLIQDCWKQKDSDRPGFDRIASTILYLGEFAINPTPDEATKTLFSSLPK